MGNCHEEKDTHISTTDCCATAEPNTAPAQHGCCDAEQPAPVSSCCEAEQEQAPVDWLLWGSMGLIAPLYLGYWLAGQQLQSVTGLHMLAHSVFEIMNTMAWGLVAAIVFVGLLSKVPREMITSVLGRGGTFSGILRATGAGVLLDLCSHGILAVGMQLYQRGASIGQVMAFLLASPWNSLSLTLILWALIGLGWTLAFIALSAVIAVLTGLIFEKLVARGTLPANPNTQELPDDYRFIREVRNRWQGFRFSSSFLKTTLMQGMRGSRMVLRWIFFGVLLAALIRNFVSADQFQTWFGASMAGLLATMLAATIIEVCSEGSVPIAADLFHRAHAPGNAFGFLMAGVSTDYTEVMSIQNTTRSWRIALFLPLVSLPQVLLIAGLINWAM